MFENRNQGIDLIRKDRPNLVPSQLEQQIGHIGSYYEGVIR